MVFICPLGLALLTFCAKEFANLNNTALTCQYDETFVQLGSLGEPMFNPYCCPQVVDFIRSNCETVRGSKKELMNYLKEYGPHFNDFITKRPGGVLEIGLDYILQDIAKGSRAHNAFAMNGKEFSIEEVLSGAYRMPNSKGEQGYLVANDGSFVCFKVYEGSPDYFKFSRCEEYADKKVLDLSKFIEYDQGTSYSVCETNKTRSIHTHPVLRVRIPPYYPGWEKYVIPSEAQIKIGAHFQPYCENFSFAELANELIVRRSSPSTTMSTTTTLATTTSTIVTTTFPHVFRVFQKKSSTVTTEAPTLKPFSFNFGESDDYDEGFVSFSYKKVEDGKEATPVRPHAGLFEDKVGWVDLGVTGFGPKRLFQPKTISTTTSTPLVDRKEITTSPTFPPYYAPFRTTPYPISEAEDPSIRMGKLLNFLEEIRNLNITDLLAGTNKTA